MEKTAIDIEEILTTKDKCFQMIIDIGFDYDGFGNNLEGLKGIVDEIVSYAKIGLSLKEGEGKLHQVESQRDYWKQEHRTLEKRMKERERNYLKTNAEKTKRILELEKELDSYKNKQTDLFDEERVKSVSMNEEEIRELQEYNLEYMEARNNEDIFGGDYTSEIELKYANRQIEKLQQENQQLKENNQAMQEEMAITWEKLKQRDEVIDEAIKWIKSNSYFDYDENKELNYSIFDKACPSELLEILQKYKGDSK